MIKLYLLIALFLSNSLFAEDLKDNSNTSILIDESNTTIYFKDLDEIIIEKEITATIYDEDGLENHFFSQYYDRSIDVKNIEIILYNSRGKEIRKLKKKHFKDYSLTDGLYSDARILYPDITINKFPVRIKYSSKVKYENSLYIEKWQPVGNWRVSVNKANLKIINDNNFKI